MTILSKDPTPDGVAQALGLLAPDMEYDGEPATKEEYPSLIGTVLTVAEGLFGTLNEEDAKEATEHFVDLHLCVTEPDMPEAWDGVLIAMTQMGDRLARFHETEPPIEVDGLDEVFGQAGMRAAELAAHLANLRLGLSLAERGKYLGDKPVAYSIKKLADGAAELAALLQEHVVKEGD